MLRSFPNSIYRSTPSQSCKVVHRVTSVETLSQFVVLLCIVATASKYSNNYPPALWAIIYFRVRETRTGTSNGALLTVPTTCTAADHWISTLWQPFPVDATPYVCRCREALVGGISAPCKTAKSLMSGIYSTRLIFYLFSRSSTDYDIHQSPEFEHTVR